MTFETLIGLPREGESEEIVIIATTAYCPSSVQALCSEIDLQWPS